MDPIAPTSASNGAGLSALLQPLLRHRRRIVVTGLAGLGLGAIAGLVLPRRFEATVAFAPEVQQSPSLGGLAGLAGLAGGLNLGSVSLGATTAPDLYASVLQSRELLAAVLRTSFIDSTLGVPAPGRPLLEILRVKPRAGSDTLSAGIRKLAARVSVTVDRRPGIVIVSVRMPSAELAAAVANRMVALLNEFNLERRQSQSRAQARFTRERLEQARAELHAAEAEQYSFLAKNRSFRGSPFLELQAARLAQRVQLKQEVYTSLSQAYEEARIAEVRDTPVLTVIDRAVPPDRASAPRWVDLAVLGLLAGLTFSAGWAYARALAASPRAHAVEVV